MFVVKGVKDTVIIVSNKLCEIHEGKLSGRAFSILEKEVNTSTAERRRATKSSFNPFDGRASGLKFGLHIHE